MPATTKKNVQPSNTIEFQRQVINEMADDLHSIFVGTAAINAASIQLAGADIGNISDVDSQTIFFYYGGFDANTSISAPEKLAEIYSHEDATVDIDSGVTVTVDDQCGLIISDKDSYEFFSTSTEQTNPQKLVGFADNLRTSIVADMTLGGKKRVGFIPVPSYASDVPVDIDDTFTMTVDDGAVLII